MPKQKERHNSRRGIKSLLGSLQPAETKPTFAPETLERIKTVSKITLALLMLGGVATLSVIAPNIFIALDKLFSTKGYKLKREEKTKKIARTFYYLRQSGFIKMKMTGKDLKIWLTDLGKTKLQKISIDTINAPKVYKWDGKWWLVAADIPTKEHKRGADLFRRKIKELHFYPLQRTLWLYPYDPRREIEFISHYYDIGRFVTAMEINRLDREDEAAAKHFFETLNLI